MNNTIETTLTDKMVHDRYDGTKDFPIKSFMNQDMYSTNYSRWAQVIEDLTGIKIKWIYCGRMVSFFIITEDEDFIAVTSDQISLPEKYEHNGDLIFILMSIFTRTCEMEIDCIPNPYAENIYKSGKSVEQLLEEYQEVYQNYVEQYAGHTLKTHLTGQGLNGLINVHEAWDNENQKKRRADKDENQDNRAKAAELLEEAIALLKQG